MKLVPLVTTALASLVLVALASCAGGGGGGGEQGTVTFAITDNASDEVESFDVEVAALRLTRASGAVVSVLSAPVQVDLASLSDLSEVVNYAHLPAGLYTQAEIVLDFANAQCVLAGQSTPAAILDTSGAPLTGQVTLPITLPNGLDVIGGRHRVLEFDFDLDQSVAVDLPGNTVTLEPTFVVRIDRTDPKDFIAFGRLQAVDTSSGSFTVELETLGGATLATVLFQASALTVWQIDGAPSIGAPGLAALAALPSDTWVQIYATIHPLSPRPLAIYVEAGAGTYNGGQDIVEGVVVARSSGAGTSPTVTVLGRSNDAAHTSFQFDTSFAVATSFANTKVLRRGWPIAYDLDEVNVGQHVRVFGALSGTSLDASASDAVIRLQPTFVFGYAAGAPSGGALEIDLQRVDLRDQSAFNWSDSGTTPPDPAHFELDVGTLGNGLGIAAGTPIAGRGWFPPVDDGAEDFDAGSLANLDDVPTLLALKDQVGGMTVDTTATASSIVLAITNAPAAGELAVLGKPFLGTQPLPTAPSPTIVPSAATTLCVLRDLDLGTVQVYLDFAAFSAALAQKISFGGRLAHFGALGQYDAVLNTVSAGIVAAVVD